VTQTSTSAAGKSDRKMSASQDAATAVSVAVVVGCLVFGGTVAHLLKVRRKLKRKQHGGPAGFCYFVGMEPRAHDFESTLEELVNCGVLDEAQAETRAVPPGFSPALLVVAQWEKSFAQR
jgi:hypothetical protein